MFAELGPLLPPRPDEAPGAIAWSEDGQLEHLAARGASFFREIFSATGGPTDAAVLAALWDLVWSGRLTVADLLTRTIP